MEQRLDFQVIGEASDGLEAVQKSEGLRPDLVILDLGLPGLNGIEAARQIRQCSPKAKILIVSQESSPDIAREAFENGVLGYVVKGYAGSELLPAVDSVLRGCQFVSAGLLPALKDAEGLDVSNHPKRAPSLAH